MIGTRAQVHITVRSGMDYVCGVSLGTYLGAQKPKITPRDLYHQ